MPRLFVGLFLLLTATLGGNSSADIQGQHFTSADTTYHAVESTGGMVVSGHPEASRVGLEVLRNGGNAVDAAVATAFALAVTLPYAGNIGGGGFAVIHFPDGRSTAIDFREVAPLAATRDMFLGEDGEADRELSTIGHLASGVPGSPAGLLYALENYGTMDRNDVIDPSIRLAHEGFPLTSIQANRMNRHRANFLLFEASARYFTREDGEFFYPEEILVQTDLGRTLERIRDEGRDGFYRGLTADLIVAEMTRGGGIITHEDLELYEPVERTPLYGSYRGYRIITMPPPSSGGITLMQLLNAVAFTSPDRLSWHSAESTHRIGEAMRRSFADRAIWLGDPDYIDVPAYGLISEAYTFGRMSDFNPQRASLSEDIVAGVPPGAPTNGVNRPVERVEGTETTHLSVVDANGMAVSLTTTVNDLYGSKVSVAGAGFLLNNEMDDFTAAPDAPNIWGSVTGSGNAVAPQRRMLSSMTPTIILDQQNRPTLVVGTPGGTTIPTTVFQVVTAILDHDYTLQEAVEMPRFHHQWLPDVMYYEAGFPSEIVEDLEEKGWSMSRRSGTSGSVAAIRIVYEGESQITIGARDPRRDITPMGE